MKLLTHVHLVPWFIFQQSCIEGREQGGLSVFSGELEGDSREGQEIFLFSAASRSALMST
jgi:hypothetical protein